MSIFAAANLALACVTSPFLLSGSLCHKWPVALSNALLEFIFVRNGFLPSPPLSFCLDIADVNSYAIFVYFGYEFIINQ